MVALVLRLLIHTEPASAPENASHTPAGANPHEREDNRVGRKSGIVVRSHSERPGTAVSVENVAVETRTDAPETVVVENRFFGGAPKPQSDTSPATAQVANPNGSIVGQVRFLSPPPPETPIDTSSDSFCAKAQGRPLTTQHFIIGTNGELANVLVYLKTGGPRGTSAVRPATTELQFTGCLLEPYLSAMTLDQKLIIQNKDATLHVARIELRTNRLSAFALSKGASGPNISFPETGLFKKVYCGVHPWEFAYVSVLPNPFFALTARDGRYAITNVPPGDYVIEAIHRKAHGTNGMTQSIKLAAGETATVDFEVRLANKPPTAGGWSENAR